MYMYFTMNIEQVYKTFHTAEKIIVSYLFCSIQLLLFALRPFNIDLHAQKEKGKLHPKWKENE